MIIKTVTVTTWKCNMCGITTEYEGMLQSPIGWMGMKIIASHAYRDEWHAHLCPKCLKGVAEAFALGNWPK